MSNYYCILQIHRIFKKYCLPIEIITVYKCYYREKPRLPVLKSFQAIINLFFKFYDTIESPLRILYFTPNFTDMLFSVDGCVDDTVLIGWSPSIRSSFQKPIII